MSIRPVVRFQNVQILVCAYRGELDRHTSSGLMTLHPYDAFCECAVSRSHLRSLLLGQFSLRSSALKKAILQGRPEPSAGHGLKDEATIILFR